MIDTSWLFLICLVSYGFGLVTAVRLHDMSIEEKAETGRSLVCRGKLYKVTREL